MKHLFFIFCLLFSLSLLGQNEKKPNTKITKDGNYIAISNDSTSMLTGKTYTDRDNKIYPVYQSVNGKLYIYRISKKTGNKYKYYINV